MIWIIGGTSESRAFYERIKDLDILMTVATVGALDFIEGDNIFVGRMSLDEMESFIQKHGINIIVDMSHPFADIVSKNAVYLANKFNIPYFRYLREENIKLKEAIYVDDYRACYKLLANLKGTFFFTTGSKHIEDFEKIRGDNRFIYRILPVSNSIKEASEAGVHMRDIIAMVGPFSHDLNALMLKEFEADYLVTKESGKRGGVDEKISACIEQKVCPIIIRREKEVGINNLDELETKIREEIS